MAATKDRAKKIKGERLLLPFPVKADTKIFAGTFVCADAAGFAIPATDTAGLKFLGVADAQADNTGGADGAKKVLVWREGVVEMPATSIAQANLGADMHVAADNEMDETSVNSVKCGVLVEYISATLGWVDIGRA